MFAPSSALLVRVVAALAVVAAPLACGDAGIGIGTVPTLEVTESGRPINNDDTVIVSGLLPTHVTLTNTGNGPLEVRDLVIEASPEHAFTLLSSPSVPFTVEPGEEHELTLLYDATITGADPVATVHIKTNKTSAARANPNEFVFHAKPELTGARMVVQPSVLDFQVVPAAQSRTLPLALLDTGSARLDVTRFFLTGHTGFSVDIAGITYTASAATAETGIDLPEPIVIDPGSSATIQVTYTATGPEAAEGQLVLVSNDPTASNGTTIPLYANVAGPCIKVSPTTVDFGGKRVGDQGSIDLTISSCGDRDLVLSAVDLVEDAAGAYGIDRSAFNGAAQITVPHGDKLTLPVTYLPDHVASLVDGQFARDLGKIRISSNAYQAEVEVPLTGFGTDGTCPSAVIVCTEPEEVIPQTTLHCSGTSSTGSSAIARYEWTIIQPSGSNEAIRPSDSAPAITFDANIVGTYTIRLKVYDSAGTPSCTEAERVELVTATDGIHVELIWHTPGDIDETDTGVLGGSTSVGSDVDLHFRDKQASDWFDETYDAFWFNPNPNWGNMNRTDDDPSLDRDDVDGAGPENLNLASPVTNRCWQIGVHYWDDWGYGPSLATVRVYIYGQLRFHWDDVNIIMGDLWDVADVCWPAGSVTAHGTTPHIVHDYQAPGFGSSSGDLLCDSICDDLDFLFCPADCP